jgi:hypothetical protein
VDDIDEEGAAEAAWEAACEILDKDDLEAEDFDASALDVLTEADRLLASLSDEESRERRAQVLEGVVMCHVMAEDGPAAAHVVEELLGGTWPNEAMWFRLNAAKVVVASAQLPDDETLALAARAVELGGTRDEDGCRGLVAELLKLQAEVVMYNDIADARALLTRVVDEFSDVDDPLDSAEDRLQDPYFRGRELIDQPGQVTAAEAAFREAAEGGYGPAWLELAVVLSWQPGREDDEERALGAALEAQDDPERLAMAGYLLGCLLHYGRGDRVAARQAFGRASTGRGDYAVNSVKELANIAVLDGDHKARRQLIAELAGRMLEEFDEDARRKDHGAVVTASRLGYARPFIAVRAWRWHRSRRREQRKRRSS